MRTRVSKAFGDRVKLWVTFDEANDWSVLGYSTDANPSGRCTSGIVGHQSYGTCAQGYSGTEPYIVGHNMLLAHAEAVDLYRTKYQPSQNGSVGLAIWFRWAEPLTNSLVDTAAAQRAMGFLVGCDGANVKGVYAWSLTDGFEFDLGMGVRTGMYYVDGQYNRYPRKSAMWFKEIISQNTTALVGVAATA